MTSPGKGIRLVLPPGWVNLPMQDEAGRGRVVDAMVRSTGLDDGQGAQLRRELRRDLTASANDAAASGAVLFAMSTSGPGGVPLPASLVVTALDLDDEQLAGSWWLPAESGSEVDRTGVDDEGDLAADHRPVDSGGDADAVPDVQATLPVGRVVRRVLREEASQGSPSSVRAEYWVTPSDDTGGYHVVMSTPLVTHGDAMLEMFDAIVSTARVGPPS